MFFYIRPVWDEDAKAYISDSNIVGLNIEAKTVKEIYDIAQECAVDLIIANHLTEFDVYNHPIKDLIPSIHYMASEDQISQKPPQTKVS